MGTSERLLVYIAFCCSLTLVQTATASTSTIASTQVTSSTNQSTTTSQVSNSTVAPSTTPAPASTPSTTTTTTATTTTAAITTTGSTAGSTSAQTTQQAANSTSSPTTKSTAKSPSLSTSLASSTTSPTSAAPLTTSVTETTTTTETPSLGGNCTGKPTDWCNNNINGAAVCLNGTCQCQAGHFQSDQSTCIQENDLEPTNIEIVNVTSTALTVSWSLMDSVKNLALEYIVAASITDTDVNSFHVNCQQQGDQNYLCSQLKPGYMYEVEITVTFNDTHSRTGSKIESLLPDTPGPLDKALSNFTYPDVTLIWMNSKGRVDNYHVRVFKSDNREEVFTETTEINMVHVQSLERATYYDITIIANSYGNPSSVRNDKFFTLYRAPDPVTNVTVLVLNETAVNVSWIVSKENPPSSLYEVTTNNLVDSAASNQSCLAEGINVTYCIVTGLEEYWMYSFNVLVSALNTTSSLTESDNITTWEAEPGRITNAGFELFNSPSNCDATKVKILWWEPALYDRNSKIVKYSFVVGTMNTIGYTVPNPEPYSTDNRKFEKEITELKSESTYNTTIYAISSNDHSGQQYTLIIRTDVCAPPDWSDSDLNAVTMQSSSTSSVTIQLPNAFFSKTEQGRLQEIGFILLPRESKYFDGSKTITLEQISEWHSSKNSGFREEFRVKVKDIKDGMFEIGSEDCTSNHDYCNGPLPEQFSFKVAAYACTRNMVNQMLCRVASRIGPYVTKAKQIDNGSSPSGLVIGLSVIMVLLAACAAFTFLWYKDYIHPGSWFSRKNNDGDDDSFTSLDRIVKNRPIKVCNYVPELDEMHKDTNLILSDQYDDINKLGQIIAENSTTNAARHENNTPKNRWVNILPFDHSRVKLQQLDEDDPTTDYINANYMPGFHNQREYIATQGPLPGTIDDFWRMVWEHGVMVIVMLTQCKEGNRVKCEKYWPDELREPKQYGDVVVNPTSISQLDKYNISIFDVSVNDETRQVIHFHYLDFPDFSANVEFDHFINFVRTVRSHVPHDMKGPMVIHCSAGVGRTGTFIATDRLHLYLSSDQFSEEDEVDIFGIVLSLRENRVAMVQTESQFIMIHDCFEKMLEEKRAALKMTDSGENLYENQGFDQTHPGSHPFPETLYENVSSQEQTEL